MVLETTTFTEQYHSRSLILLLLWVSLLDTACAQCTICQDAQQVSLPEKLLAIPGFPLLPCEVVDATLAFVLPNETSTECELVQSLGSLCGCPVRPDGCSLCSNGEQTVSFPEKQLPAFLSDMFLGFAPTCEILEAHLRSVSADESLCLISQSFITDYCGCPADDEDEQPTNVFENRCLLCSDGGSPSQPDRNITIGTFEFGSCAQFEEALSLFLNEEDEECSLLSQAYGSLCGCSVPQDSCSLCRDGSPVSLPEKPLEMFKDQFGGLVPTCEVYESFVAGLAQDSDECSLTRLYGTACGCPPVQDYCEICPGESITEEFLNKTIHELSIIYDGFTATCFEVESYLQYQIAGDTKECSLAQHGNFLCGCSDGVFSYMGADTRSEQAGLAWAPRVASILSLIGSLCIIQDVLRSKKKRAAVYSQLVLGMSVFDVVGAIAWGFSTVPISTDAEFAGYIYGAHGNNATCKLQGFMIQLNYTPIFYNISLSTYYFLVIVHRWRDSKLKSNRWWLHGAPVSLGVALAFGGLPFYKNSLYACYIQNPPVEETWYPLVFFTFAPIFSAIIFTTLMMMCVYFKVRQQSQRAARWRLSGPTSPIKERFGSSNTAPASTRRFSYGSHRSSDAGSRRPQRGDGGGAISRLQREVFNQSLFYLFAFYLSWTFMLTATLIASPSIRFDPDMERLYPFFATSVFLAPLQGFWNAAIYFRPRLLSRYARQRKRTSEVSVGFGATTGSSGAFKFPASWRRRSNSSELAGGSEKEEGANNQDAGDDIDTRGLDFDPSNEIAYLVTGAADRTTSDDGMPAYQSADLDAIREEFLEEQEGATDQKREPTNARTVVAAVSVLKKVMGQAA